MTSIRFSLHILATVAFSIIFASEYSLPAPTRNSHSTITAIVQKGEISEIRILTTLLNKEKNATQLDIYYSIFNWCLENKKIEFLCALIKATPSRILSKQLVKGSIVTLNQWLLNGAIMTQHIPLITEVLIRTPFATISRKDHKGLTALDYAHKTGNQVIIEALQMDTMKALQNTYGEKSFFTRIQDSISEHPIAWTLIACGTILGIVPALFGITLFYTGLLSIYTASVMMRYPLIIVGCAGLYVIGTIIAKDEEDVFLRSAE